MFLVGVGGNLITLSAGRTGVRGEACEINYRMVPLAKREVGGGYRGRVTRRSRAVLALVAGLVLLAGCEGGSTPSGSASAASSPGSSGPSGAVGTSDPLLSGLDVCSLVSAGQVRRAVGQVGEPTSRLLTTIDGYDGLVDQCGFGVSFDSYTFVLSVGLEPATRKDLERLPGRPAPGIGDAALAVDGADGSTVAFLEGHTLAQVHTVQQGDGPSRFADVKAVVAEVARSVPSDPPETDDQTRGACAKVDREAVDKVLGAPAAVSRSLNYVNLSSVCSWATGTHDPRTVAVTVYSSQQAGPFLANQKFSEPSHDIPGISDDAFSIPGVAYAISPDGQAVSVSGAFPPVAEARRPLPVTPQLTDLLASAVTLMQ
jgi:hypothetical protein